MKKPSEPILYLVAWDDSGIVKIGYSDRRRWRKFPDARLVLALPFHFGSEALIFEMAVHAVAFRTWRRAFATAQDALPYLGRGGGGYLECYQASAENALDLIGSQFSVTMPRHIVTSHCGVAL